MTIQGDIAKEALGKFPDTPIKTLARMIYKENPEVFLNLERARDTLRYYTGKKGDGKRNAAKDKKHFRTGEPVWSPFSQLPEGIQELGDWKPYYVPGQKVLLLADMHIPFHERGPLEMALEYGHKHGADTIVLDGDVADFYSISRWEKDPRQRDLPAEIDAVKSVLSVIREGFPDAKIIFKEGNHEERYVRYLEVKAPELLGVNVFELGKIFELKKYSITPVGDKRLLKIGALNVIHGHEFGQTISSPVNPARGYYLRGKENCIGGHYHQPSSHSENTMNDAFTGTWSLGCLCNLHPKYRPLNKWGWGFALVEKDGKQFQVNNKKIINNDVFSA